MNRFLPYSSLLFAAVFAVPSSDGAGTAQAAARPAASVLVEKATMAKDEVSRKYIGRIEAINKVSLQPRVSGTLVAAPFQEGDIVQKGQILFEIEDTRYKASVQAAEAKIQQLDVKIDYALKNYERQSNLYKTNAVSKDQVENSLSLLKGYEAEKLAAEAELILAREDLRYTRIAAPLSGRIGRLTYSVGNYITPTSQPLATITQIDPIYVRFPMSERDVLSLFGNVDKLAEEADVRLITAATHAYPQRGTINLGDNEIVSDTDSLTVWARFDNPKQTLQSGGITTVIVNKKDTVRVPVVTVSAVQHDGYGAYVYVVGEGNKIEKREVIPGSVNGRKQSIYQGLKEGEIVVIDGTHKVAPGAAVNPVFDDEKR